MEFQRSKYSRRIRKKKRVGEFRQYGFLLDVYCGPDPEGKIIDGILDVIIKKRLFCSGGGNGEKYSFFVDKLKNESDKEWISDEIKKIDGVEDVVNYKTVDVWHGDADQYFEEADKIREEYGKKERTS